MLGLHQSATTTNAIGKYLQINLLVRPFNERIKGNEVKKLQFSMKRSFFSTKKGDTPYTARWDGSGR